MTPRAAGLLLLAAPLLAAAPPIAPPPDAGANAPPPPAPDRRPPPPAPARPSAAAPPARQIVLANGLRVVVVKRQGRPVVVVRLLLARGALSDPANVPGATFLAVHLASDFHEKTQYGEDLVEEKSFRMQLAELGGSPLVEVDPDLSTLGVSGYAQDTGSYLRMLADAVMRPRHGEQSFRARRNVLLDAIEDLESSDPAALARVVTEAAFGPGHPYARPLIGTAASLGPLGLEDVVAQQKRVLVPDGATLLVVGDVETEKVFADARAAFARWTADPGSVELDPPPPPSPPAVPGYVRDVGLLRRQPASTLVVCATRPLSDLRGSDAGLDVLATLVGEGPGSRLAAALREASGLTYDASATIVRRRHARALLACSPLAADRAGAGIRLFRETLEAVRAAPPAAEELQRARAIRLARVDSAHDDALGSAEAWVEAVALGRGAPRLAEERAALEKVTAEEVQALAAKVLRPETLRWIVSGDPKIAAQAVEESRLGRLQRLSLAR